MTAETLAKLALEKRAQFPSMMSPMGMGGYGMSPHFRPGFPGMGGTGMGMGGMGMGGGMMGGPGFMPLMPGMSAGHCGTFPGYGPPARNPLAGSGWGGSFGPMGGYGQFGAGGDEDSLRQEYEGQKQQILNQSGPMGWTPQQVDQEINKINTYYGRRLSSMRAIQTRHGAGSNRGSMAPLPEFHGSGSQDRSMFGGMGSMPPPGAYGGGGTGGGGMPGMGMGGNYPEFRPSGTEKPSDRVQRLRQLVDETRSRSVAAKGQATNDAGAPVSQAELEQADQNLLSKAQSTSSEHARDEEVDDPFGGGKRVIPLSTGSWYSPGTGEGQGRDSWNDYRAALSDYNRQANRVKAWQAGRQPATQSLDSDLSRHQAQLAAAEEEEAAQRKEMATREKAEYDRNRMLQEFYARRQMMPQQLVQAPATPSYAAPPSTPGTAPAATQYAAPPAATPTARPAPQPAAPAARRHGSPRRVRLLSPVRPGPPQNGLRAAIDRRHEDLG